MSHPSDFTFAELATLLGHLGYFMAVAGKTGGSRVAFTNSEGDYIRLHRPHPGNVLKPYQIDEIILHLTERGIV